MSTTLHITIITQKITSNELNKKARLLGWHWLSAVCSSKMETIVFYIHVQCNYHSKGNFLQTLHFYFSFDPQIKIHIDFESNFLAYSVVII